MKNTKQLIKIAEGLANKYAGINAEEFRPEIEQGIKTALANASAQNNPNMMIPFVQMAQQDHVNVSFDVTRNDNLGFKTIKVNNLVVIPNENNTADKYQPLTQQIKTYLEKNWELYPTQRSGVGLTYSNFSIHLEYNYRMNDNNFPSASR